MVRERTEKKTSQDATVHKGSKINTTPKITGSKEKELPDIELDGIPIRVMPRDIDRDGVTGGLENIYQGQGGITPVIQPSEISEMLKTMNEDIKDPETSMRSIDLKTRINWLERNSIAALDTVSHMHVCRPTILTHVLKRLNVSINGQGRKENLDAIVGERENRKQSNNPFSGMADKVKGMFGG